MSEIKRETSDRGSPALAAAISATLGVAGTASAQTSGGLETIVVTATRRAENLQDVSGVDQRVRQRRHRDTRAEADGRLRQVRARPVAGRARARRHDHRVPRRRLVRTPVRRRVFVCAVSRRAADHAERPESRSPTDRHRAARGAARAAGHALRRELAVRHAAHHHQQAGSVRVRWLGRPAGHEHRRGRGGIRRERHVQCAAGRGPPCAALRGVHRGGRRVHRQRPERQPAGTTVTRGRNLYQRRPGRRGRQSSRTPKARARRCAGTSTTTST